MKPIAQKQLLGIDITNQKGGKNILYDFQELDDIGMGGKPLQCLYFLQACHLCPQMCLCFIENHKGEF
jgi:hypothetical protein